MEAMAATLGPASGAAKMQPVPASQGQRAHRPFAPVVVDFHLAVAQEDLQAAPLVQGVIARFGQFASGRDLSGGFPPAALSTPP